MILYQIMEQWLHETNKMTVVKAARPYIGDVLSLVQENFSRKWGDGWNIQKMHGLTKMQYYMCLFGSRIILFWGPGECNHICFVKGTGFCTQGRIESFCSQVVAKFYETILPDIVKQSHESHDKIILPPPPPTSPTINLTREYLAYVWDIEQDTLKQSCQWTRKRKGAAKCEVHRHLMFTIAKYASDKG